MLPISFIETQGETPKEVKNIVKMDSVIPNSKDFISYFVAFKNAMVITIPEAWEGEVGNVGDIIRCNN